MVFGNGNVSYTYFVTIYAEFEIKGVGTTVLGYKMHTYEWFTGRTILQQFFKNEILLPFCNFQ